MQNGKTSNPGTLFLFYFSLSFEDTIRQSTVNPRAGFRAVTNACLETRARQDFLIKQLMSLASIQIRGKKPVSWRQGRKSELLPIHTWLVSRRQQGASEQCPTHRLSQALLLGGGHTTTGCPASSWSSSWPVLTAIPSSAFSPGQP